ncbi:hypothetical protein TCAL_06617 [Tigriopus californicus]|uniref:Rap-GAP domain-containing protein n=1 Tax=Tigriopus californicus TaxID=6832 RepID=A0A553PLU3_TIGCA|nr:hypothetical protein TCAL_06617 [Tigriopus californicus]
MIEKMNCFVCNLPILSHQVGLVWQGGNGVDDLLREQMEMDIIRGRLGCVSAGRRDSSSQITTIETTLDDFGAPPSASVTKRRRSSLAQLTDLLKELGSGSKDKSRHGSGPGQRGKLGEMGKSFGGVGCTGAAIGGGPGRRTSRNADATDFMSKVRKRRESSADITIFRKGSGSGCTPIGDISKLLSGHRGGFGHNSTVAAEGRMSVTSSADESSSRRSSTEIQQIFADKKSSGPLKMFKRRESRGRLSPMSPESDSGGTVTSSSTGTSTVTTNTQGTSMSNPPTCLVRMPSSPGPSGPNMATTEGFFSSTSIDSETQLAYGSGGDSSRRNSLKPNVSTDSGTSVGGTSVNFPGSTANQQLSPTGYRRTGLRRQSTAYEEGLPIKSAGSSGRRGSRPFLSPEVSQDPSDGSGGSSLGPRSSKSGSGRRDSLSPDYSSATDDGPYRTPARRDSRPLLSPEPDLMSHSRDGSPRQKGSMIRRRSSGLSEDCGGKSRLKTKPYPSGDSSSAQSSRDHSPKDPDARHPGNPNRFTIRRQSTTEEILIARGFRRESTTEDIMRCRNFRRQSSQMDNIGRTRGRRDSCTQITDGQLETMTIESEKAYSDSVAQTGQFSEGGESGRDQEGDQDEETPSLYENNHYHEECLKCNSCGMNLSGPNQKRARRFKNQILCDLHFADMALMESSDFMQQLRGFKPQSLGCAVARRKSSTTLIFPLPPQACSDEFCDGYPHNLIPTPGYWIECSRAISNQGSAWTNEDRDLHEIDEGITDSPDGSLRDGSVITECDEKDSSNLPRIREPKRKKTPVEEQWEKYGQFGLTSVEQETHEKYFYGTEHWNYFTNDEDLGPVILSLKQENINGRDQFRVLVRAVSYTIHGLIPASCVFADRYNREEVVASLGREINLNPPLTLGQLPDTSEELLKLDQVFIKSELKVGVIYVKENQYSEEEILGNNEHSENFDEFLTILGEKVRLKGFDRYKGGLDTVHDLTGHHSVFTHWRSIEVMFHVSTLLPYEQNDPQKLQRKRHIGNDIVCVVFLEADNTQFSPSCIKSHFLHTFIVVRCSPKIKFKPPRYEVIEKPGIQCSNVRMFSTSDVEVHLIAFESKLNSFQVSVVTRDEVGAYKPYLWEQSTFNKGPMFREWMLTKIVNAERASYSAPKFARMQERTRSQDQMAKDFAKAFFLPPRGGEPSPNLFDITFLVGQGKNKSKLYGVRAILGVRSRVFQEILYGISTGFGSPQVPVAELLARAVPSLHGTGGPQGSSKGKSSNFLQVPEIEGPRPKSVPNSPSIPRAFTNLRNQLSTAWSSHTTKKKQDQQRLTNDDKKKWASSHDCSKEPRESNKGDSSNIPQLSVPRLSVCADAQKVDRSKLAQTEFPIIEFDGETFRILLTYLHTGSCPLSCLNIPGLICSAEHYDLPELLQACFHHAKQFIRVNVCCQMLCALENYYWRYTSASELVNMILAFIETRSLAVFQDEHFLQLSESMVQMIMNRNLEVSELAKFETMLKWARHRVHSKSFTSVVDARIEFRCCMDRLTRDLKLYRIAPQDLIKIVLPSKAIRNDKILDTLTVQATSGMYRVQDSYLEACQRLQRQESRQFTGCNPDDFSFSSSIHNFYDIVPVSFLYPNDCDVNPNWPTFPLQSPENMEIHDCFV